MNAKNPVLKRTGLLFPWYHLN